MTAQDVEVMRVWRYPAPYEMYDLETDPDDIALMLADIASKERWFAVSDGGDDGDDDVAGFVEFVMVDGEVELGLGLRPDLTGIGLGVQLVEATLAFARTHWSPITFVLDVFPWNERAIKTYERAGFVQGDVYTRHFENGAERRFLRMSRPA